MEGLSKWFMDISGPIVTRVMIALGIGTVSYTGASSAIKGVISQSKYSIASLGSESMQIIAMAGFFEVMAITSGGIISGLAWMVMKKFALSTVGAPSST